MSGLFSPPVDLLPMSVNDVDEILRIEYKVYSHPWSRANFTDSIASGYSCWVCRVGGELVGYYVVMMAVDEAHLLNISVGEKRQGCGFGAQWLTQRAEHIDAAKAGVNAVHIVDGRVPHAMLLEILTDQAYGTMIRSA